MLELRPNCEMCDADLAPSSPEARICTYECTFCAECVERLGNVCPNCGGGFAPRPIRPTREWRPGVSLTNQPASTDRRTLNYAPDEVERFTRRVRDIQPNER